MNLIDAIDSRPSQASPRRIATEYEFWLMLVLALAMFAVRPTALSLRGEETRRGLMAREMIESGNWLVPTQQGIPRFTKPPLHYWAITIVGVIRGEVDVWAVRLPSLAAMVLTAIAIYVFARQFSTRMCAFGSAIAYLSMLQVMQIGRLGEMEALFTLLLSSSLFVWYWAYEVRRSPALAWSAGYTLCALAALVKGPQAPVYFVGGTAVYLTLSRRWRALFHPTHLMGVVLALAVAALWIVPYSQVMGWSSVKRVFVGEAAIRMSGPTWGAILAHLGGFPFKLLGCLLPWSILLFAYLDRRFRESLRNEAAALRFCTICVAIAVPTVWLPPGGRTRYLMPLFPLCAVLIGAVFSRIAWAGTDEPLGRFWRNNMRILSVISIAAGFTIAGVSIFAPHHNVAQTAAFAFVFIAVATAVGLFVWRGAGWSGSRRLVATVAVVTAFWGLAYNGVIQNFMIRRSTNEPSRIAQIRDELDLDTPMRSLGPVHHFFAFHYGDPVAPIRRPADFRTINPGEYFCYDVNHMHETLPFEWEEVAVICCDRYKFRKPLVTVVVGRRNSEASGDPSELLPAEIASDKRDVQ